MYGMCAVLDATVDNGAFKATFTSTLAAMLLHTPASAIVMIHDTVANLHLLFWHTGAYRRDDPTRFMPGDIKFFFRGARY